MGNAQERSEKSKIGSVSIMLHGSLALIGFGAEVFLRPFGLGGQFTFLPLGGSDSFVFFYEPGAYLRFYLFDIQNTCYVRAGPPCSTPRASSAVSNCKGMAPS